MNARVQVWLRRGLFVLAAYIAASYVLTVTIQVGDFHSQSFVRLIDVIEGEAVRPFVYRTLAPSLVRALTWITPKPIRVALEGVWEARGMENLYPIAAEHATEGFWTIAVFLGSLVGCAFAMRRLVGLLYEVTEFTASLTAVLFVLSLPLVNAHFIYDYPNLMLFTFCLGYIVEKRWRWFYPLFVFLCISKETSILIPAILVANLGLSSLKWLYMRHLILQGGIWLVITVAVRVVFADNPGALSDTQQFMRNLRVLTDPGTYVDLNKYMMPIDLNLMIVVPLVGLVVHLWRTKPRFLRRALMVGLIPFLLSFPMGCVEETRVFMEFTGIIFLLVVPSVFALFGTTLPKRTSNRPEECPTHAGVRQADN